VLLWARRVLAKGTGAAAVDLLEIKADAGVEAAQEAFHKVARKAHPDLHRATVTADELELITQAYARVAGAYHDYKESVSTGRTRDLPTDPPPPSTARPANAPGAPAMSSKALVYFRKAELALRRGNLQDAVLQLKLANAADPGNTALRTALAEVQAELAKPPG
jgi:hypothetical protein